VAIAWALNALMMKAVSKPETLANFYQTTRRKIPKSSHFLF
jgi:hypothetical protein